MCTVLSITLLPWKYFFFFPILLAFSAVSLLLSVFSYIFHIKKMCLFQQAAKWHFFSWLNLAVLCTLFSSISTMLFFFFWGSRSTLELS